MTISAVGSAGFRETALAARVELVHGDMFEGPSDLVVLPCSEVPTVAPFVERRLKQFQIPALGAPMKLGEVRFLDLGAASQIAPTAAYAASVRKGVGSEVGAIESIAAALGTYALANRRVHLVAAPLLGTGAGELAPRDSFEAIRHGFLDTAPHGATLRVYVPSAREFAELERIEAAQPTRLPTPRVFISYTKTDEQHAAWVQNLAEWLLANGVEARLDVWDLSPGMDVAQWMSNELDLADRVLLICNEEYASRADRRHGGVGWEIRLVQGVLLGSQSDNPDKFIPIVRAADVALGSPGFLRSAYCLHWPPGSAKEKEVAERTKLLRHLFRLRTKPPLGEPPDFIRAATAGSLSTKKGRPERRALTETSGRASTQIFLDAGDKPGKEAREALKQAIAAHRKRFEDNPAENTGHGSIWSRS